MPGDNTIIFVTLTPKSGKEADLEALLRGMCEPSRAEGGCVTYNLYKKADGGGAFHFFEIWKTQADLDAHRLEPHYKNFREKLGDLVDGPPSPNFLERVDATS